jgi:cysteine desulfurase
MIDFDRNATSPLRAEARRAMLDVLEDAGLGNPSSVHRRGQRARAVLEDARARLGRALGADAGEVVLTSGGSEADGLAIVGAARALRAAGKPWGVLTSPIEHPAVLGAAEIVRAEGGVVAFIEHDGDGRFDPAGVAEIVRARPEVGIVSLTAGHHEIGHAPPIAAIVSAVKASARDVLVHTDAVQAFGKVRIGFADLGVDLMSVSAHKIGGPAGIGALVVGKHVRLAGLWGGGAQERGRRAGTEATALAAGFGAAATVAVAEQPRFAREVPARVDRLRRGLVRGCGAVPVGDSVGNTVLARLPGCDGQLVVIALDLAGFACSTGAACSSGTVEPSRVMLALGWDRQAAREVVRFSLGLDHTDADVDALLAVLPPILARVRNDGSGAA